MSTYYSLHCTKCQKSQGYPANHGRDYLREILKEARVLIYLNDQGWDLGSLRTPSFGQVTFDLVCFLAGHLKCKSFEIISEYGDRTKEKLGDWPPCPIH